MHQNAALCGNGLFLYSIDTHFDASITYSFGNIVGKEEIARNEQFLLSRDVSYSIRKFYPHLSIFLTLYLYLLQNWKILKLAYQVMGQVIMQTSRNVKDYA